MRDTVRVRLGLAALLALSLAGVALAGCAKPATQTQTPPPPSNEAASTTTSTTTATTNPAAPYSRYDLVFAVAGDSRSAQEWMDPKGKPKYSKYINTPSLAALRNDLIRTWAGSPGFFLAHLGDFGIRGGRPIFESFKGTMSPMWAKGIPVYVVKGNHEVRYYVPKKDSDAESYDNALKAQKEYQSAFSTWTPPGAVSLDNKGYSGLAYRFKSKDGSTAFIVMDSYYVSTSDDKYHKGYYSDPELKWLQASLIAYKNDPKVKHVFVMSHQPAFSASVADGSLYAHYNADRSARANWIMWALMDNYKVDAYFCGHSHFYHRWNVVGDRFGQQWPDLTGFDSSEIGRYRASWETTIPHVLNGAAGAPLQSLTSSNVEDKSKIVPAEASSSTANFSIVYVKGDTVTVEVYSYSDDKVTLIDKFQGQNHVWKNLDLVPEQP